MDNYGFIHEKLDIKLLILFVLNRLPAAVDELTLAELVRIDEGVLYFDYTDYLQELTDAELVTADETGYRITAKGAGSICFVESTLPYSVRSKAERLIAPVEERMRREAMIVAKHSTTGNGCLVELAVSDGISNIMELKVLVPDDGTAEKIEKNFRPEAENFYYKIVELLQTK